MLQCFGYPPSLGLLIVFFFDQASGSSSRLGVAFLLNFSVVAFAVGLYRNQYVGRFGQFLKLRVTSDFVCEISGLEEEVGATAAAPTHTRTISQN